MTELTALAALARTAVDAAVRAGIDREALLAHTKLSAEAIDDLDGRVPVADLLQLWQAAAELSGDAFFGLHAGERVASARTLHVVGFAARASATLEDCVEHVVRFGALANEASRIEMEREPGRASFIVSPRPGLPIWPRVYPEMALAGYFSVFRRWVGGTLVPLQVTFQHPRPDDTSEHQRLFGCPIAFGADQNQLVFDARSLAMPLDTNDPDLLQYFEAQATALLEASEGATFGQRVREAIGKMLGAQAPTLENVAKRMATSPRTLQRHLARDGLSFGALVDDVRRVTALRLLASRDADLATVAFRTGYRDLDAFRAAVVRWTGKTPRDVRGGP
jgi:AraC-like DNA-binding protein